MDESQGSILGALIFIGIIIAYVVAKKLIEGYTQEKLRQQVNWCVNGRQGDRVWPLLHYINSLAMLSNTPKYKVTGDSESTDANTLIDAYKNDLQNSYLTKRFSSTFVKLATKIRELDFFILTLNSFLHANFEDIHHKNTLYREISRKNYGMWGGQLFDAECELTNFGIVYQKLLYATQAYCENSAIINSSNTYHGAVNERDSIDTRRISISRM